ncbi:DUF3280 domain-containing protein [Mangrovicoccus algicola]|nr:DUF3280 domain-containing protein [Mangrovicoccus algicola]
MLRILVLLLAGLGAGSAALAEMPPLPAPGASLALPDVTFVNASAIPTRPEEQERARLLTRMLRERFAQEGFVLADLGPVAADLDRIVNPAACNGCEIRIARKAGAEYVAVGQVRKISELILSMDLVLRETGEGRILRAMAVDIRSNTDQSWTRGMRYVLTYGIFAED